MTTCEASRQIELFPISATSPIASSEARLAKTPAQPTRKAAASMERGQGSISKPSELSEKAALVGALLRMSLASEIAESTGFSTHWRRSATPSNRPWWVLRTSAPTTSESDHGCLLSTPRKSDAEAGGHGDTGRMGTVRHILHRASSELCPTPTKRDIRMDRWSPAYDKRKSPTMDALLDGAMRGLLPTPLATVGREDGAGTGGGSTYPLRKALGALRRDTILATPRATDADRGGRGDVLSQLRGYPSKHAGMCLSQSATGNLTAPSMQKWAGARALAELLRSHGLTGTAALPVTYGWMMGYPPGWLLRPALALVGAAKEGASSPETETSNESLEKSWAPTATPCSRKSRKRSAAQSCEPNARSKS